MESKDKPAHVPVRMKDIANALGVSVVTVSKVLNNHPDIGQTTRERVLACMQRLNYQPNLTARGLVMGRSYIVGLIVPDLIHAFYSELAKGLSSILRKKGYGLVISSSEESPELEQQEIAQMLARRVDVLLLASCQSDASQLDVMQQQGTPYVLVDRRLKDQKAHQTYFVGTNDELAGELATQHLVDLGRRRIAHIGGQDVSPSRDRGKGYRRVLVRNGIEVRPEYIVELRRGDESAHLTSYKAMQKLLALRPRPDAVFCYNDPAAIGAISAVLDAGLKIPQDIAIAGCGNIPYAPYLRVPLTSVDQSAFRLGEEAGKLALSIVDAPSGTSKASPRTQSVVLKPKLIVRESTVVPTAKRKR
ncbi:MAG: LacI family DNA-binding transcriptional regulator [Acidobacteriaceae bacterium]